MQQGVLKNSLSVLKESKQNELQFPNKCTCTKALDASLMVGHDNKFYICALLLLALQLLLSWM